MSSYLQALKQSCKIGLYIIFVIWIFHRASIMSVVLSKDLSCQINMNTLSTLSINGRSLYINIADDNNNRSIGLMHCKSMPNNYGMLFDFQNTRHIYMWMKNTYIPLDIIFLDKHGIIKHIAKNTTPHSTDIITSKFKSRYALEINSKMSDELSMKIGDILEVVKYNPQSY